MDKDTIARLRGLLDGADLPWTSDSEGWIQGKIGGDIFEGVAASIESAKAIVEALNALPALLSIAERAADVEGMAEAIVQRVSELPDRSSPDDWTEAMLVTADELYFIVAPAVSRYVLGGE